ncbi:MAG: 5-formyltetrahydrofolate cyclo-ligase, partial [Proteobacteria bacterium]|nr:5-formyltetrahydrofolate cyclo-ligase [Pseudomonadota bacterium]
FLPVLNPANHSMVFVRTHARTVLKNNWYGIPEPTGFSSLPINRFDIVLLPLLAFDASGSRIGMGGGYYDRALEMVAGRQYYRTPQLIGLAFDKQKCSTIQARPWDVPLDGVFTESGFKLFTNYTRYFTL